MKNFVGAAVVTAITVIIATVFISILRLVIEFIIFFALGFNAPIIEEPDYSWYSALEFFIFVVSLGYILLKYWKVILFRNGLIRRISKLESRLQLLKGSELISPLFLSFTKDVAACAITYKKEGFKKRFNQKDGNSFVDYQNYSLSDEEIICSHFLDLSKPVISTIESKQKYSETKTSPVCFVAYPAFPISALYNLTAIICTVFSLLKIPFLTPAVSLFCSSVMGGIEKSGEEKIKRFIAKSFSKKDDLGKVLIPSSWPRWTTVGYLYFRIHFEDGIHEFFWSQKNMDNPKDIFLKAVETVYLTGKVFDPAHASVLVGTPIVRLSRSIDLDDFGLLWRPRQ